MGTSFSSGLAIAALAILLLAIGWLALRQANRTRHTTGLPPGRLVYADTGDWRPPDRPLFSDRYQLTGRPDYLIQSRHGLIPVEVKSSQAPPQPYPSHVLQLAAYCLLVEETTGQAPPRGLINYANATFEVDYTPDLRGQLLAVLDDMRALYSRGRERVDVPRSHDEPSRCGGCGYRPACDQSLV